MQHIDRTQETWNINQSLLFSKTKKCKGLGLQDRMDGQGDARPTEM